MPRERRRSRASRRSSTNAPRSRRTSGSQLKSLADIGNFNGKSEMEKMGGKAMEALVKFLICLMNPSIDHMYFMILEHVFPVWWAMFAVLRISCKMRRSEHPPCSRGQPMRRNGPMGSLSGPTARWWSWFAIGTIYLNVDGLYHA